MLDLQELPFIELNELQEISEILTSRSHPSVFEAYKKFQFLNIRMISLQEASLTFTAEAFILHELEVYYYKTESKKFEHLPRGFSDLLELLNLRYLGNQKYLNAYSAEIEKLEDALFLRNVPSYFMDIWFDLKKDLAKIENFYYLNSVTYKEFFTRSSGSFRDLADEFKDIDDMIHFQMANHSTLKARIFPST
jgi:hypothetical protein